MARAQSMPVIMLQSESSTTPPPPEELREAAAPVWGTPPAPEAPTPEPPAPQSGTEDRDMRDAIQLLTRLVADQAHRHGVGVNHADRSDSLRARDFLSCNPPEQCPYLAEESLPYNRQSDNDPIPSHYNVPCLPYHPQ